MSKVVRVDGAQCLKDLGESNKAAEERRRVEREEELEWIEAANGLGASTKPDG